MARFLSLSLALHISLKSLFNHGQNLSETRRDPIFVFTFSLLCFPNFIEIDVLLNNIRLILCSSSFRIVS